MMLLFHLMFANSVYAFPGGCSANLGQLAAHMTLIEKTMQVDEPDRNTEEEYAANPENGMSINEVRKAFAPTGDLECPVGTGSGNLTVSKRVVTAALHSFFDRKTCEKRNDPSECVFVVGHGSNRQRIPIDRIEASGSKCPLPIADMDDWVILRLKREVNGIDPYSITDKKKVPIKNNEQIVAVGGHSHDFLRKGKTPKHIGNCLARDPEIEPNGFSIYFKMTCDLGHGPSGGAVLVRKSDKTFELAGIIQGTTSTSKQIEEELSSKAPKKGPYSSSWHTGAIPITSEFHDALIEVSKKFSK